MPTMTPCPACQGAVPVPDEPRGEPVTCPACQKTFPWPTGAETAPAAPTGPAAAAPDVEVGERPLTQTPAPPAVPGPPEKDTSPCPYCGRRIPTSALFCHFCGEDLRERDERPWEDPERFAVRRDCEPHRGTLILVFGVLGVIGVGFGIFGVLTLPFAIMAWVMGHQDLNKMNARSMDPEGRGLTQAGYVCGIIGTAIGALYSLCCIGYLGFFTLMVIRGGK